MEQVRNVIGEEEISGLSDRAIKDALWDSYYDVDKTVGWAMGKYEPTLHRVPLLTLCSEEQERIALAKERKGKLSIW